MFSPVLPSLFTAVLCWKLLCILYVGSGLSSHAVPSMRYCAGLMSMCVVITADLNIAEAQQFQAYNSFET
jgi:hypothetical protein